MSNACEYARRLPRSSFPHITQGVKLSVSRGPRAHGTPQLKQLPISHVLGFVHKILVEEFRGAQPLASKHEEESAGMGFEFGFEELSASLCLNPPPLASVCLGFRSSR